MSHERTVAKYAAKVKELLSGDVPIVAADLVTGMAAFDEEPINQHARIIEAMKNALQTLALDADQLAVIKAAYTQLNARFELD